MRECEKERGKTGENLGGAGGGEVIEIYCMNIKKLKTNRNPNGSNICLWGWGTKSQPSVNIFQVILFYIHCKIMIMTNYYHFIYVWCECWC